MGIGFDRNVLTGTALLAALVLTTAALSFWNTRQVRGDEAQVVHTQEVLAALGAVRANVHALEAAQRTFVLTGEGSFLRAFRAAEARAREHIAALARLTDDNPDQQGRLAELGACFDRAARHLGDGAAVRQQNGFEAARAVLLADDGEERLAAVDRTADALEAAERDLLRARRAESARAYSNALLSELGAAVLGLAALGLFVWLLRRSAADQATAAAAVREQREWLRTTLTSIGDGVIATDAAGRVTLMNPVAEALTGWTTAVAAGRPLTEVFNIVNESTRAAVENPALRALEQGVIVGLANHTVLIARGGTEYPIDDSAAPIRAPDGAVAGAVLVFRDITERKREEHERDRLAETLQLAVDAADLGTWVWDPGTDQLTMSDRTAAIYRVEPGRTYGRELMRGLLHPDFRARSREEAARAAERRTDYDMEYPLIGERPRWVSARGRGVYSESGALVRMTGVVQDITVRKAAEAALRESERRQRFLADLAATTQPLTAPDEVMAASAGLLAEHLGADRCAYAEVEDESVFVITGDHPRGVPSVVGRWPVAAFGAECLRLMRANEPYVVADAAADPRVGPADRPAFAATNSEAVICVPLHKRGRFTAAMTVHQTVPRAWAPAEVELVSTVAARCWEALERARSVEAERRLHTEVAAERARLEEVFRFAPSFMAVLRGPEHVFELANDRYTELVGGREVIGQPVRAALPEIEGQGFFEILDRVYRTGEPYRGADARVLVRAATGALDERFLEFVYQPIRDASGNVSGVLVQGIDLTERRRAEGEVARVTAASERRKRLYETALSNTPDLVYVFDLGHRFTYANEALLAMWGRTWDDAIGKNCLELGYEPWHAAMHNREIDQVAATKRPIRGEVPFTGTNGRRIYDYIFVPVLGADGEVEAVAGTTRDVTERQAMEQELRDADRRKDEFIALLAHELRNPLAPIRNELQVIRLAPSDPAAVGRARAIMDRQLAHMVRLVDDLLDVSRINRNKMELRRARVTIGEVIASAVETARPSIDEARHELSVDLPPEPVHLDADLTRLAQVFSNLLTNSAKYTPPGGRIWISAAAAGGELVATVRDNGVGIPAAALTTIFDMFSQVSRSTERNAGGLGIGLALVKGLVEMHGGTVTAASPGEDAGTTFTVRLAVLEGGAGGPAAPEPDAVVAGEKRPRRVLVVDDNRDGAESMAEMLALLGDDVRTAHDGLEAVSAAEAFRPEVILMDVGMPKLDGLGATRRIRERPWGASATIVALTGWGQEADRAKTREAGCDGHLVKPVSLADLEKLLAELRSRR